MADVNSAISIITLNANRFNNSIKKHTPSNWIKSFYKDSTIEIVYWKMPHRLKLKG